MNKAKLLLLFLLVGICSCNKVKEQEIILDDNMQNSEDSIAMSSFIKVEKTIKLENSPSSLIGNIHQIIKNFISFHKEIVEAECLDIHKIKKRLPDDVAKEIIVNETGCSSVTEFQSLSLLDRNKCLLRLHEKGISIRQLNRLTGIPKGIIARIVTG